MEQIQKHQSTLQIVLMTLSSCLGSLYIGYQIGVLSLASDTTFIVFNISKDQIPKYSALLTCLVPLGAAIGSLLSGKLLDIYSRRQTFTISDMIGILGGILSQFEDINFLLFSRFLGGIATGLNSSLVPLYIQEIAPNCLAGKMGIIFNLGINLGIILATFLGIFFDEKPTKESSSFYWKFVFFVPIFISFSRYILLQTYLKLETPLYYALRGQEQQCENTLKQIYKEEYVQEIKDSIKNEAQKIQSSKETFQEMFSLKYRKRLFIGCALQIFQQWSGINAVIMYSGQIFAQSLNNDFKLKNAMSLMSNIVLFGAALFSSFVINIFGRKKILMYGSFLCFLTLFALTFISISGFHQEASFIFIFGYYIAFNFSLGPIVWLYNSEILPEKGISIATTCNWIAGSIITLALPYFDGNFWPLFAFFAFICISCFAFIKVFLQETQGKNKMEIYNMYLPSGMLVDENKNLQEGQKQKTEIDA